MSVAKWVTMAHVAREWGVARTTAIRRLRAMNDKLGGRLLMPSGEGKRRRHDRVNIAMLKEQERRGLGDAVARAVLLRVQSVENTVEELEEIVARHGP